jgi:Polyketide cyclase / dehydrase and lipid transport
MSARQMLVDVADPGRARARRKPVGDECILRLAGNTAVTLLRWHLRTIRVGRPARGDAMAKVQVETMLQVPASAVWNMIDGFNELARWHPAVVKSEEIEDKSGVTTRRLTLSDGGVILAELEEHDDTARTYSYSVVETPLPGVGYHVRLHVRALADGYSCTVDWSSELEASDAPESDAVKLIRGLYEVGFDNLRRLFGG